MNGEIEKRIQDEMAFVADDARMNGMDVRLWDKVHVHEDIETGLVATAVLNDGDNIRSYKVNIEQVLITGYRNHPEFFCGYFVGKAREAFKAGDEDGVCALLTMAKVALDGAL